MTDTIASLCERLLTLTQPNGDEAILSLWFQEHRIGTLTQENCLSLSAHPMGAAFHLAGDSVRLEIGSESLTDFCSRLARALFESKLLSQWRDELLDVRPYSGTRTLAKAERGLFRFLGLETASVYALAQDENKDWILAKRSPHKFVEPGRWDALAAGLVAADEAPIEALEREISEEAGLMPTQYSALGAPCYRLFVDHAVPKGWMRESASYYTLCVQSDTKLSNQDGEVTEFACCDSNHLLNAITNRELTLGASLGFLHCLREAAS